MRSVLVARVGCDVDAEQQRQVAMVPQLQDRGPLCRQPDPVLAGDHGPDVVEAVAAHGDLTLSVKGAASKNMV